MSKVSILITAFQRPQLLKWNLHSLAQQNIPFGFETIVLNDGIEDETRSVCEEYQSKLKMHYIFTGQRNLAGNIKYRVPGFALNIGIKSASGDVLVISCAEMFHINNTIELLTTPVFEDGKLLATSMGMDDDGTFLDYISSHNGECDLHAYHNNYPKLNTKLPFLMAINRQELLTIGGYDEDFTGFAYDDNDVMDRLKANGCRLVFTEARTIHLYHPRHDSGLERTPGYLYNAGLYRKRKGQIMRNAGREWGVIPRENCRVNGNIRIKVHRKND